MQLFFLAKTHKGSQHTSTIFVHQLSKKKKNNPSYLICFSLFIWISLFFKARMPCGENQTKKAEDLFKTMFSKVQALIPDSRIYYLEVAFAKHMEIQP